MDAVDVNNYWGAQPPPIQHFLRVDAQIDADRISRGAFGTYPHEDSRYLSETAEILRSLGSVLVTDTLLVPRETIFDSIANSISVLPFQIVFCNRSTDASVFSKKEIIFGQEKKRKQIGIFVDPPSELQFTSLWLRTEFCIDVWQFKPRHARELIEIRLRKFMEL